VRWMSGRRRVTTYGSAVEALFQPLVGECPDKGTCPQVRLSVIMLMVVSGTPGDRLRPFRVGQ
jgi:hypothetical protein